MVKHNNIIPNIHCKKKWADSSRGPLKVKLSLNQAQRKLSRRRKRAEKAAKIAPAPLKKLKPIVHCPTQKYSAKVRLGKGFTLDELKAIKLIPQKAMKLGIMVDYRRKNKSEESYQRNVARLEEYMSKLIVLKKGETADSVGATQYLGQQIMPIVPEPSTIDIQDVTTEMKEFKAYTTMRVVRKETFVEGKKIANKKRKEKE